MRRQSTKKLKRTSSSDDEKKASDIIINKPQISSEDYKDIGSETVGSIFDTS